MVEYFHHAYHSTLIHDRLVEMGQYVDITLIADAIQQGLEHHADKFGHANIDQPRTWWEVEAHALEILEINEEDYRGGNA